MTLRLRQICLVAHDLGAAEREIAGALGTKVCHRDASVAKWGLENFLMPVGSQFLEVVAPTRPDTAAGRYLERRKGDGGYMVILQTDDLETYKDKVRDLGIRLVAEIDHGDYLGMQLHPRDTGGAILSIDWNEGDPRDPAGPWHPAGPDWQKGRTDSTRGIRGAELQSAEPEALAARWADILGRPVQRDARARPFIGLDDAVLRFVPATDGRGEGLGGLDIAMPGTSGETLTLCGTRIALV